VAVFLIAGLGVFLGFILIALMGSRPAGSPHPDGQAQAPEHAWISSMGAEDFGKLLSLLFAELKFEVEKADVRDGAVDLFAVNPTPITGGRIYVRGLCRPPLGMVDEDEVRIALDTARAEMAGKAVVATSGSFTPEARAAAAGAPIDLLDGAALLALVKKHLPPVAVAERV
jgi:hypothetical protein